MVRTKNWKPIPFEEKNEIRYAATGVAQADSKSGDTNALKPFSESQIDILINHQLQQGDDEVGGPPSEKLPRQQIPQTQRRWLSHLSGSCRPIYPAKHWYCLRDRIVHGDCHLPEGYALAILPVNFSSQLQNTHSNGIESNMPHFDEISMSYSPTKAFIALSQALYAFFTFYESLGHQVKRYGFAAFGLTVFPYFIMSLVNLFANLLTPDFPSVFLIRDPVMYEAEQRPGATFPRVVGQIKEVGDRPDLLFRDGPGEGVPYSESISVTGVKHQDKVFSLLTIPVLLISMAPVVFISISTRFQYGSSTTAQETWILYWYAYGAWQGFGNKLLFRGLEPHTFYSGATSRWFRWFVVAFFTLPTIPTIGSLVVVGQMLKSYGTCTRI